MYVGSSRTPQLSVEGSTCADKAARSASCRHHSPPSLRQDSKRGRKWKQAFQETRLDASPCLRASWVSKRDTEGNAPSSRQPSLGAPSGFAGTTYLAFSVGDPYVVILQLQPVTSGGHTQAVSSYSLSLQPGSTLCKGPFLCRPSLQAPGGSRAQRLVQAPRTGPFQPMWAAEQVYPQG